MAVYRVSGISKISLMGGENQTPEKEVNYANV